MLHKIYLSSKYTAAKCIKKKKKKIKDIDMYVVLAKGVGMIRVDFGPISETVYIDIILNTIIER